MHTTSLIGSGWRNFSILPANPGGSVAGKTRPFWREKMSFTSLGRSVLRKAMPSVLYTSLPNTSNPVFPDTDLRSVNNIRYLSWKLQVSCGPSLQRSILKRNISKAEIFSFGLKKGKNKGGGVFPRAPPLDPPLLRDTFPDSVPLSSISKYEQSDRNQFTVHRVWVLVPVFNKGRLYLLTTDCNTVIYSLRS